MGSKTELLLEELRLLFGALYLSDLRRLYYYADKNRRNALMAIPEDRYSLQDWTQAAAYILGQQNFYGSIAQAKADILQDVMHD